MPNVWQIVGRYDKFEIKNFIYLQITKDAKKPNLDKIEDGDKEIINYNFKHIKKISDFGAINIESEYEKIKEKILCKYDRVESLNEVIMDELPQHEYVYFLKADNGLIKIGKTKDINNRITQLNPKLPYDLKLLHTIKTNYPYKLEGFLHKIFSDKRKKGEWFDLSSENQRFFCNIFDYYLFFSEPTKDDIEVAFRVHPGCDFDAA